MASIWMVNSNSTSSVHLQRRQLQMNFLIATEQLRYFYLAYFAFFQTKICCLRDSVFKNLNLKLDRLNLSSHCRTFLEKFCVCVCVMMLVKNGVLSRFHDSARVFAPIFRWDVIWSLFTVLWPFSNISWCLHFHHVNQWPFTHHVLVSGMGRWGDLGDVPESM